jgi:hypothetical protein
MSDAQPPLDATRAHALFSAECFHRAWSLIDKPQRTADEDEQMLLLGYASLWHWTQRADCTPRHRSIGYWQVSRIHALLGQADEARRAAEKCLQHSRDEPPFYRAYAHEALARAAMLAGDRHRMADHLGEARRLAEQVADAQHCSWLENDLNTIG